MLIGTGVDLIEIERIAQSIERYGERFLRRVYTDHEIAYCSRKRVSAESFAARSKLSVSQEGGPFLNCADGPPC